MEFKKYQSITNVYNTEFIERIKASGFDKDMQYVVEEI